MKAYLIDPLKVGTRVVVPVDVDDHEPLRDVLSLLGLPPGSLLEESPVGPEEWDCTLHVADPSSTTLVRHLGEFRFMKRAGDYRSVAGRGVVLCPTRVPLPSEVLGLLASSGAWVSA